MSPIEPGDADADADAAGAATLDRSETGAWRVLRAPQAARVLGGSLLGRVPLGGGPLALLVFGRERLTLGAAALLVAAYTAGVAIGGPALARATDRWRQPPVLWLAMTASTAGYVLVVFGPSAVGVGVAGSALAGLGAPPFEAGLRVLWRDLLPASAIASAYTLDIAAQELIFVLGPLATVAAVQAFGSAGGLGAMAVCQLIGTVWFATAPSVRHWRGERVRRHWLGALRAGALRLILVAVALVGAGIGSMVVAVTGYAEVRGSTASAGWLIAAQAGGALLGGLAYTRVRVALRRRHLPWIAAAMSVSYLPLLLQPAPVAMALLLVLSGFGLPVLLTVGFLTVDEVAPPGTAAEAFAWVGTAFAVGSAIGSALTGALLDAAGSVGVGFLVPPVVIGLGAVVFALLPRTTRAA